MTAPLSLRLTSAHHGDLQVLGPLSLTVEAGETVALTGPSGVGKTTLLRIVAGLHRRFDGVLSVPGRLAVVFQEPTLLPWRTAAENLILTTGCSAAEAATALETTGLGGLGDRYPAALSLGQQRRLALVRAFLLRPDVLLMDEAFVSLDPALAAEMTGLFRKLRQERPLATLFVTHSPEEAAELADRTLVLEGQPARIAGDSGAAAGLSRSGVTTTGA